MLYANLTDAEFNGLLNDHNLTMETLTQKTMANSRSAFESLDHVIALNAKRLAEDMIEASLKLTRQTQFLWASRFDSVKTAKVVKSR